METKTVTGVNIAPSSTHGHFIEEAREVVNLDTVNETFLVKGKSRLKTTNHTTLDIDKDCLITCQNVFDPFANVFVKSKD